MVTECYTGACDADIPQRVCVLLPPLSLFSFFFKIYLYCKVRYTERKIFRPLIHSPNSCNSWS